MSSQAVGPEDPKERSPKAVIQQDKQFVCIQIFRQKGRRIHDVHVHCTDISTGGRGDA